MHVHWRGDVEDECRNTAGHYNPLSAPHGGPDDVVRYVGRPRGDTTREGPATHFPCKEPWMAPGQGSSKFTVSWFIHYLLCLLASPILITILTFRDCIATWKLDPVAKSYVVLLGRYKILICFNIPLLVFWFKSLLLVERTSWISDIAVMRFESVYI